MSKKVILCRCEDAYVTDVQRAVASGWSDLEEVKRYTGFGTAIPARARSVCAPSRSRSPRHRGATRRRCTLTTRPPLVPTELKYFAGGFGKPSGGSHFDDS